MKPNKGKNVTTNDQIITVKLTPKAAKNQIKGWDKNEHNQPVLKCSVTAVPENGKANLALIKLLAKHYKTAKSNIQILSGQTNRIKKIRICP